MNKEHNYYYKLDENKNAIPCTLLEWSKQHAQMRRTSTKHVGSDEIEGKFISTVWLGLDHNFYNADRDRPHIFETMIHDIEKDQWMNYQERYSTWKEAEEGHEKAVQWVNDGCKEDE